MYPSQVVAQVPLSWAQENRVVGGEWSSLYLSAHPCGPASVSHLNSEGCGQPLWILNVNTQPAYLGLTC